MIEIEAPDGTIVEFPDGTPDAAITAAMSRAFGGPQAMAQQPSSYQQSYTAQGLSGVNEGLGNTLGFPVDMMNSAMQMGANVINAVAGTDVKMSDRPFLGSDMIKDWMAPTIAPPTDQPSKQFVRRIGQEVGASVVPTMGVAAKSAAPLATGARSLAGALGSGTGAATAQQLFPNNPTAELIGQLIGGMTPLAAESAYRRASAPKPKTPTVAELKDQARALYDKADSSGVVAPQAETKRLADSIRAIARDEGLISSSGRVSSAYPKVSGAIDTFDDYAQGQMTVKQMRAARKTLTNMAKSIDQSEARIGEMMLGELDDFVAPLSPDLTDARAIYHSVKKGETIEQAIELAGSRAGQFTGSGFENALRTEFRQLERRIIKGQLKGFSKEEVAAISKVAQGGPVVNALRTLGKLAPTGPVSFGISGGMPFAIGNAIGGPLMGATASGATMGAGFVGRSAATKLTARNADLASQLMRGGPTTYPMPATLTEAQRRSLASILAAQGINAQANSSQQ